MELLQCNNSNQNVTPTTRVGVSGDDYDNKVTKLDLVFSELKIFETMFNQFRKEKTTDLDLLIALFKCYKLHESQNCNIDFQKLKSKYLADRQ